MTIWDRLSQRLPGNADSVAFDKHAEKRRWMFKSTFLACFMACWIVAPFAILLMPGHVAQALLVAVITTSLVTPLVSRHLISNLVHLLEEQRNLTWMAHHDGMTGLMNRTYFLNRLQALQRDCVERGEELGIVTIDIDHFKSINDRFGHAVGDEVIIGFAHLMRDLAPDDAVVGRTGGEEFTIGLAGDERRVEQFVKTLCIMAPKMDFAGTGATISAGYVLGSEEDYVDLCVRADAALYDAKHAGRNCYRIAA